MKKILVTIILFQFCTRVIAQKANQTPELWREKYIITNIDGDTLSEKDRIKIQRDRSENALRKLKNIEKEEIVKYEII